jgi:formylglycine-generating enzyme required for sulfatase activity
MQTNQTKRIGSSIFNETIKTRFSKHFQVLSVLCLAVWAVGPRASAQTAAGLSIQIYAGLSITGTVGTVYSVEYVTDLAQTNTPSAWRCLEFLQLPANPYLWADKSAPATGQRLYRAAEMSAPTNMVFIPPGTFRMGSPTNEVGRTTREGPQTAVIISRGYWMGKYEVTQGEYLAVVGSNPSFFNGVQTNWPAGDYGTNLSRPVEQVSWNDATNYCAMLTQQERLAARIPTNSMYRLPTEAEWEYACRAETSDRRFSHGDDPDYTHLPEYAWHNANSSSTTHPVGQKSPNPWGLYDMHGNVWEWCQDWLETYPGGIAVDPHGPAKGSIRGGDWRWDATYCRSATRFGDGPPPPSYGVLGFRVVLAPGQP